MIVELCRFLRKVTRIKVLLFLRGGGRGKTIAIISLLNKKDGKTTASTIKGKGFEKLLMIRSAETPRAFGGKESRVANKTVLRENEVMFHGD